MSTATATANRISATAAWLRSLSDEQRFLLAAIPVAALTAALHVFCRPEQVLWFWESFSFWSTMLVNFGVLLIVGSVLAYNGGKGLTLSFGPEPTPALTAGDAVRGLWGGFDISPDILIITDTAAETGEAVQKRMQDAINTRQPGQWVVVITFRHPAAVIVTDDNSQSILFGRSTPPYQGLDWPENLSIRPQGYRYENETWEQYHAYLKTFLSNYPEWARIQKPVLSTNPLQSFMATLTRRATVLLLALICTVAVQAQKKSEQVLRYLGNDRAEMFAPEAGPVKFVFQQAVLLRNADGAKTLPALLKDDPYFTDEDNAGRLIGIRVTQHGNLVIVKPEPSAGKQAPPAPPAGKGELTPAGSSALPVNDTGKGFWGNIPDAGQLESMKAEMMVGKKEFGRELLPRHEFVNWLFWNWALPVLFLIGGIAFYMAKVAADEGRLSSRGFPIFGHDMNLVRERATRVVSYVCWITGGYVIFMDLVKTFFFADSLWWFFLRGALVIAATYRITRWIIPNPTIVNTSPGYVDDTPRLNTGR